jgi:hypothetical protein
MTDFLDEKRAEIAEELTKLKPLVEEYRRLEAASEALADIPAAPSGASAAALGPTRGRRGPGRPRGSKTTANRIATAASPTLPSTAKPTAKRKRRRRKRTGTRAREALKLIGADPGITIPSMAAAMGIHANYLYKVIPSLETAGKIRKDGHGWYPKAAKRVGA